MKKLVLILGFLLAQISFGSEAEKTTQLSPGTQVLIWGLNSDKYNNKLGSVEAFNPKTNRYYVLLKGHALKIALKRKNIEAILPEGTRVEIKDLVKASSSNGKIASIRALNKDSQNNFRYEIQIDPQTRLRVKRKNLNLLPPVQVLFLGQQHLHPDAQLASFSEELFQSQFKILSTLQKMKQWDPDFLVFDESSFFTHESWTHEKYLKDFYASKIESDPLYSPYFPSWEALPKDLTESRALSSLQSAALIMLNFQPLFYDSLGKKVHSYSLPESVLHKFDAVFLGGPIDLDTIHESQGKRDFLCKFGAVHYALFSGLITPQNIRPTEKKSVNQKSDHLIQAYSNLAKECAELIALKEKLDKKDLLAAIRIQIKIQKMDQRREAIKRDEKNYAFTLRENSVMRQINTYVKRENPSLVVLVYGKKHNFEERFKDEEHGLNFPYVGGDYFKKQEKGHKGVRPLQALFRGFKERKKKKNK